MPIGPIPTVEEREALLKRILTSVHFAHAYSLRRIVEYLERHDLQDGDGSPKEYDIAVSALHRAESFDPKIDPIVRVSVAGIRDRLRAYFEHEGRNEDFTVSIPKGVYRLVYTAQIREQAAVRAAPAAGKFWHPYLNPSGTNILVYTEVLFFRDEHGNFVRNIYVNDVTMGVGELGQRGLPVDASGFTPSFHFVSAGEMHSLLAVLGVLTGLGAKLEARNSRFFSWAEMQGANLILLGSARTNPFLHSLQGTEPFVITAEAIVNTAPLEGEKAEYRGSRYLEGVLERVEEYALVTRRPGLGRNTAITLIAANHGRAIEGAGQFLAREDGIETILKHMGLSGDGPLPAHFQVLLRVEMFDFFEEVVNVEYLSHRIIGD